MKFTYYGHACFTVEVSGKRLLFDPFITGNPLAKDISLDRIKADYILITHAHADHIQDAVALAKSTGAKCIANYEIYLWLLREGVENAHPMNSGGKSKFDFGYVHVTSAVHSSSFVDGSYGGNPVGFVISAEEGCFYYAGDTALTYDMKIWGKQHELDFVVLPIGDNFTMGVEDAARAAKWLKCKETVGVHYNSFPSIMIDTEEAIERFSRKGIQLHLPAIGDEIIF
jgi:L-ascorbate metabolism protein UlaG (beta-lactamase superfamily)